MSRSHCDSVRPLYLGSSGSGLRRTIAPAPRREGRSPRHEEPTMNDELQRLEREKQWWKRVALTAIVALLLLFIGGATTSAYFAVQAREAAMRAEVEAQAARAAEELARH